MTGSMIMLGVRAEAFALARLVTQAIGQYPWTTEQADEAERLVRQIAAASIVARNGAAGQEVGAPAGSEAVGQPEDGVGGLGRNSNVPMEAP